MCVCSDAIAEKYSQTFCIIFARSYFYSHEATTTIATPWISKKDGLIMMVVSHVELF